MISNHAPSASRTTLQSERSSLLFLINENSASRTQTYDIMINSHALLPTELLRNHLLFFIQETYGDLYKPRGNVLPSQGGTPNYYRR